MSALTASAIGILLMVVLLFLCMPLAYTFALSGVAGIALILGVEWVCDSYSKAPSVKPGFTLFDDISEWRESVVWPDLEAFDWVADVAEKTARWDRKNKLSNVTVMSGHFERMHFMIGFENAFCAFYEEPEAVKEFFAAMTDYKLRYFAKIKEFFAPDILCEHDDWGTNRSLFSRRRCGGSFSSRR